MEENENNNQPKVEVNNSTPKTERKGFNITSMVLGIIAILCTCYWYINIPCSIIAIIFSIAGRHDAGRGMGIAGMVLGIIAIVLYFLIVGLGIAALVGIGAMNEMNVLN